MIVITPPMTVPLGKPPCQPHSADGSSRGSTTPARGADLRDVRATTLHPLPLATLSHRQCPRRPCGATSSHSTGRMAAMTTTGTIVTATIPEGPRSVVVLGSTGSIGTQALDLIAAQPQRFRVVGLAAGGTDVALHDLVPKSLQLFGIVRYSFGGKVRNQAMISLRSPSVILA